MIKLKDLLLLKEDDNYNPEWDYVIHENPPKKLVKMINNDIIPKLTPLLKALGLGNIRIAYIKDEEEDTLARYISGSYSHPYIVLNIDVIVRESDAIGRDLEMTIIHELVHAYLESKGLDMSEHNEDVVEGATVEFMDFKDPIDIINYIKDCYPYLDQSIVKQVNIENLLPDKKNMEVAVDSLRKGMQSLSNSPIEVYPSEDKYIVADGHHRLLQAIINGESSVNVKILDSEKPMSRKGTVVLDFLDGDYYGLDNNLESGWLIKRL